MRRVPLVAVLGTLVLSVMLPAAIAEHEPSHRYFVSGRVIRDDGTPACDVVVQVEDNQARTNDQGLYRIQIHLHDATVSPTQNDVGRILAVQIVGTGITKSTTAVPSQVDDGWGESRVDFEVPTSLSGECTNPVLLVGLYVGIPAAALVGVSIAYLRLVRPWLQGRPRLAALTSLSGIGKGRLLELRGMGIETLQDLAEASPAEIARRSSLSRREAKRLVQRAQEKLRG